MRYTKLNRFAVGILSVLDILLESVLRRFYLFALSNAVLINTMLKALLDGDCNELGLSGWWFSSTSPEKIFKSRGGFLPNFSRIGILILNIAGFSSDFSRF